MGDWIDLMSEESNGYWEATPLDHINLLSHRPVADSDDESSLVERIFRHYRHTYGENFPFDVLTDKVISRDFGRVAQVRTRTCLDPDSGQIKQSMMGLTTANGFHPEMVNVRCRTFRTPMEVYLSDDLFRQALRKRVRFGDSLKPWGVRKALCAFSRTQRVSNFRPTAAKALYQFFKPRLTVDFCAGWGGRLLGAMASNTPYVGIDPNTLSVQGNQRMLDEVSRITGRSFDASLIQGCAEDLLGNGAWEPDLIFTSPPYFDVERYSEEPTQSYLRYPTQERWYQGFLHKVIEGSYTDLSRDGFLVLNVNPDMKAETIRLALQCGFRFLTEWELLLSRQQFTKGQGEQGNYRHEPVLIFSKGAQLPKSFDLFDVFSGE